MDDEQIRQMKYRVRVLPGQLDRARRRLQHLEREAIRLGMAHLLQDKEGPRA